MFALKCASNGLTITDQAAWSKYYSLFIRAAEEASKNYTFRAKSATAAPNPNAPKSPGQISFVHCVMGKFKELAIPHTTAADASHLKYALDIFGSVANGTSKNFTIIGKPTPGQAAKAAVSTPQAQVSEPPPVPSLFPHAPSKIRISDTQRRKFAEVMVGDGPKSELALLPLGNCSVCLSTKVVELLTKKLRFSSYAVIAEAAIIIAMAAAFAFKADIVKAFAPKDRPAAVQQAHPGG